jgi:hypothetical protein
MLPEKLAEKLEIEFIRTEMVAGVEVALYKDDDGNERYHLVYPDGTVNTMSLSRVFKDGNYAKGITRKGDMEVMLDDDGVHEHW